MKHELELTWGIVIAGCTVVLVWLAMFFAAGALIEVYFNANKF